MSNLPNPYVGPRAYESYETLYGRDRELRQLAALLVAERIVLLHSPSGAGKTSLLQAGLIPRMRADDFYVLPVVRVNLDVPNRFTGKVENRYLFSTLLSLEEDVPEVHRLAPSDLPELSLDAYLNRRYRPEGASTSELLVFDQFEEVLTVLPSDREGKLAFFEQLGTALRNRDRWAIFAMREDYVATLAPYLRPIPNRLSAAFRLDLLDREAAMQAIQKPAQQAGVDFTTPAAIKLVDDLSQVQEQSPDGSIQFHAGLYVEPVQLQVVCYRLWDSQVTDDRVITVADLGQVGSVDDSLAGYYAQSVARVAAMTGVGERAIREWFGNRLITPEGVRSQVLQRAGLSDGLDNRAIFQLVDAHILRAEKRAGSTWFELAHDRLIAPVRKSNAGWFAANLRLFQVQATLWDQHGRGDDMLLRGKALAEARQEAIIITLTTIEKDFFIACARVHAREVREKRRNRAMTILAIAATIAMIVAVILGLISLQSAKNLEIQKSTAEAAKSVAITAQVEAEAGRASALTAQATAEAERTRADQQSKIALSSQLILESQNFPESLSEQYPLKGLLAIQAARMEPGLNAYQSLDAFLNISERLISKMQSDQSIQFVKFSPNGNNVVSVSDEHTIQMWNAASGNKVVQMVNVGGVRSVAFSPDGSRIVSSSSDDNIIQVWDAATGNEVARMEMDEKSSLYSATFSPDGSRIASGSSDNTVQVWDAATGNEVARMETEKNSYIYLITFSQDGSRVFSAGSDHTVQVWDVATGNEAARMETDNSGSLYSVAFSPDVHYIVFGDGDGMARVWEVESGKEMGKYQHRFSVGSVAFSPDGSRVVSGSADGSVCVWDAATGNGAQCMKPDDPLYWDVPAGIEDYPMLNKDAVHAVVFSPDGHRVVSGYEDGTARIWDVATGEEVAWVQHDSPVYSVDFSSDGRKIVSSGRWSGSIIVGEAVSESNVYSKRYDGNVYSVSFSPDGRWVVTDSAGHLQVREIGGDQVVWETQLHLGTTSAFFSPDSRLIVSSGATIAAFDTFYVWDPTTGNVITIEHNLVDAVQDPVKFSPDSRFVISLSDYEKNARIWDAYTGMEVGQVHIKDEGPGYTDSGYTDGRLIVFVRQDGNVQAWDASTRKQLWQMQYEADISSVAFSPNGSFIGLISGKTISVLDSVTGNKVARLEHGQPVKSVVFSQDGSRMASSGNDFTVRVRDTATGRELSRKKYERTVRSIALSPDGRWVASVTGGTVWVWNAETGEEVARMFHDRSVSSVVFSPDSRWIAVVEQRNSIQVQKFQLDDLVEIACSRLTRNLTQTEWQQYIGGILPYDLTCPNLPAGGE